MYFALVSVNSSNKMSSLVPFVYTLVDTLRKQNDSLSPLEVIESIKKCKSDFMAIATNAAIVSNETPTAHTTRVEIKAQQLYDFLFLIALVKKSSSHTKLVTDYINNFLRDDLGCPTNELDIVKGTSNFSQFTSLDSEDKDIVTGKKPTSSNNSSLATQIDSSTKQVSQSQLVSLTSQVAKFKKKNEFLSSKAAAGAFGPRALVLLLLLLLAIEERRDNALLLVLITIQSMTFVGDFNPKTSATGIRVRLFTTPNPRLTGGLLILD